ncbi:MAG: glycosyltransferase [Alphaproteobacteria bacterium]|nr:glycosyltransferase [Alphaproteobacteria bacterium]
MKKLFSVVIPVYKNEENLPHTIPYILEQFKHFKNYKIELIFINDGSPDNSWNILKEYQKQYPKIIRLAKLTRNYGQGNACKCGLNLAKGDVIGFYTADMQDPFEFFSNMLAEWEKGYKLVIASRKNRDEKGLYVYCAKLFHKIMHKFINNRWPIGGFDFFIIDKFIKETFYEHKFEDQFDQQGLLWLGYEYKALPYTRNKREYGKSGYSFISKVLLALTVFISYSDLLLNIILFSSFLLFGLGFLTEIIIGILSLFSNIVVPSFIHILSYLNILSGIVIFAISIVGKYIWSISTFVKNYPRYIVETIIDETTVQNKKTKVSKAKE